MSQMSPTGLQQLRKSRLKPPTCAIGELLDLICEREHTSLTQLAALIDVDHSMLSRIRTGQREPRPRVILKMLSEWPITESEKVAIGTYFKILPPGFRIVRSRL